MRPASRRNRLRRAQPHLGTLVEIEVDGEPVRELEAAIERAFQAIATVHRLMSFHDASSDVGRLNRASPGRAVTIHSWTRRVLEAALALNRRSGGTFDIAVGTTMQRLGLLPGDPGRARGRDSRISSEALEVLSNDTARIHHPDLRIDLGGIAKGFAVDRAVDMLVASGVAAGLVNAGGDLRVFGAVVRRVHIRDPRHPGAMLCAIEIADQAIASSAAAIGGNLGFAAAGSVIDPWRQTPASAVLGASVRAASCMMADALTKVVMISGEAAAPLLTLHQASALLVSSAGAVCSTPDWHRGAMAHAPPA